MGCCQWITSRPSVAPPSQMTHPQQKLHHQVVKQPSANVQTYHPITSASPASFQPTATQPGLAPLLALMYPLSSPVRRSRRGSKCVKSKFDDYLTSSKLDISNRPSTCDLCHSPVWTQQPATFYIQPCHAQGPYQSQPYQTYQPGWY